MTVGISDIICNKLGGEADVIPFFITITGKGEGDVALSLGDKLMVIHCFYIIVIS